jgi:hypothetical protein
MCSAKSPDARVNPSGFRGMSHGTSSPVVSQPDGHEEKPNPVAKEQRTNVGTVALGPRGLGHLRLR